jgi:hypothetical protein
MSLAIANQLQPGHDPSETILTPAITVRLAESRFEDGLIQDVYVEGSGTRFKRCCLHVFDGCIPIRQDGPSEATHISLRFGKCRVRNHDGPFLDGLRAGASRN